MPAPIALHLTRVDWALLALLSLIWGGAFVLIEYALEGLPPITLAAVRVSLAAAALYAVLRLRGQRMPVHPAALRAYIIGGSLGVSAPFALIPFGQTLVTAGMASILNAMVPIWGVLIAHFATSDERLTPTRGAGVLVGFAGVLLVIAPSLQADAAADAPAGQLLGQAAIMLAALGYACGSIYSRRFKRMNIGPLPTSIGNLVVASVTLIPVSLIVEGPWALHEAPASALAAAVALALLATSLAFILFFRVLASAGATNTQLVTYLIPISAIGLGALLRGERLAATDLAGMAVIAVGLMIVDGRPLRWVRGRIGPALR